MSRVCCVLEKIALPEHWMLVDVKFTIVALVNAPFVADAVVAVTVLVATIFPAATFPLAVIVPPICFLIPKYYLS